MAVRSLFRRVALVAALAAAVPAGLNAADPERDLRDAVRARQALLRDPELATLNLGVRVRDRVATLWGPVPSALLSLRAERALRDLIELAEVRNELEVTEGTAAPIIPRAALAGPAALPDALPPNLPRITQAAADDVVAPKAPVVKAPAAPAPTAVELPTIPLPRAESLPARMPQAPELRPAVEALVRSKDVYRGITFAVRDGRVHLRGAGHTPEVMQELARSVSRLPGVGGVVVKDR